MNTARHAATTLLLATGCPTGAETGAPVDGCKVCSLRDEHGASVEPILIAEPASLAEGEDAWLDWSELGEDLAGRETDPVEDIVEARLFVFGSTSAEAILEGLAHDTLDQGDVGILAATMPEEPGCALSDFELQGHWIRPETDFVQGSGTWLVELLGGDDVGLRSLALLVPSAQSTVSEFTFTSSSATLEATLDLSAATPVMVAPDANLELEWSNLASSALGGDLSLANIDSLVLTSFLEPQTIPTDLLALDTSANEQWTLDISGATSARLSEMAGERPFPGIDTEHGWLVSLHCGGCDLPIPRFVAALEVAD